MRCYLLLLILFSCFTALAQDDESNIMFDGSRTFVGGVLVGMNATQVDGDSYSGYHKAGLNVGGVVYANINASVGISIELLYSQKGAIGVKGNSNGQVGSYFEKYKMNLNYVEAPLLFHIYHAPWQRCHINLGASYSALISNKESFDTYYPFYIDDSQFPFKRFEIDGIAGMSYVWGHFMLEVRYQYGITPIRLGYFTPQIARTGTDQRNNMFAFRIGYLF